MGNRGFTGSFAVGFSAGRRSCAYREMAAVALAVTLELAGFTAPTSSLAAGREADTAVRRYNIPSGDLRQALDALAVQANVQIVYAPELVSGKKTGGVSGSDSPVNALSKLLSGSGLAVESINASTFLLKKQAPSAAPASSASTKKSPAAGEPAPEINLEKITVTGSRLPGTAVEGPVPVKVYTHADIDRSGQSTLSDFLNTLSEVSTATPESGPVFAGQTSVRLRGLPLGTTLVLINGRRLEGSGATSFYGGYFDLNNIPTAIVERIEVVPEGSSAVYGSDALAGVINIILKKNFDGFQADAHYGGASGSSDKSTDFAWGRHWSRGSMSVIGSYYTRGELAASERKISSSNTYGPLVDRCDPGNVYSVDGSNLPGLNASSASVRPGAHGMPTLSDFDTTRSNRCRPYAPWGSVIPQTRRASVFSDGTYKLNSQVELFAELMYSRNTQKMAVNYRTLSNTLVPASNAYNPFGEDVLVNYQFKTPETLGIYDGKTEFMRPLIGARGNFLDSWEWEIAAWEARDHGRYDQSANLEDSDKLSAALASSDPQTALNPFTSGAPGSSALLRSIYSSDITAMTSTTQVVNGFLRGTAFELPSGAVDVVLGGEYSRTRLQWKDGAVADNDFTFRRHENSFFGEARIPIVPNKASPGLGDILVLTTAFRRDRYNDFGSKSTGQYALEWRPFETLLVRGAYAQAFSAPGLVQLYTPTTTYSDICCVNDPQHDGEAVSHTEYFGGNPKLKPQTGQSRSVGIVWTPELAKDTQVYLTRWQIDQRNRAAQDIAAQTIVDNPVLFPGRVVRDPVTGEIQSVDLRYLNFGQLNVAGVDLSVETRLETGFGLLMPSLNVTRSTKYRASITPDAPAVNRLSLADTDAWAPRWKGSLALSWSAGPYSATGVARYVSSYTDYQDLGPTSRRLGDFWIYDISGRYEFGKVLYPKNKYMANAYLQLGVVNLFDSRPRYSAYYYGFKGYDPEQYDIRGRFVYANVGVRF